MTSWSFAEEVFSISLAQLTSIFIAHLSGKALHKIQKLVVAAVSQASTDLQQSEPSQKEEQGPE